MRKLALSRTPPAWLIALCAFGAWACTSSAPVRSPAVRPEENRFTRRVLVEGLDEPMALEFDRQGRVYWIERKGGVRRLDEATGEVSLLGTIPVTVVAEAGLIGMLLDRQFATSRQMYLYYSAPPDGREMRLSRFTLGADDRLDLKSEVVMMRWPAEVASHMGGGMTWDASGNLHLTTGDNSEATQYNPVHWTNDGGKGQDSQRSAANSNDLRGKILRIHPEPNGTYTIPPGNLFPPGTPKTRPEIYVMGVRNPWRPSIDSKTGYLYWGDVGPDAGKDSAGIGPMGYDEFNVATSAGYYGWPYAIGYNRTYNRYDPATNTYGPPLDPTRLTNDSPNNSGVRELPPARPAMIAYPYGVSDEYPLLSSGGRCAGGGPIFRRASFGPGAARPFPDYYEGKWFVTDCVRAWTMVVTLDSSGTKARSIEQLLSSEKYTSPLDMDFGPSGDLYIVEYGPSPDGRLSKIEYNAGNRAPRVQVAVDRPAGATPLRFTLSSAGTVDYDKDPLRYEWVVAPAGGTPQRFATADVTLTLDRPGVYDAVLTVTDSGGAKGSGRAQIVAGNEPPQVTLAATKGNRSFYFPGGVVEYQVTASDQEDGSDIARGVIVTADYVPSGMTPAELAEARGLSPDASMRDLRALAIMARSDCRSCHTVEQRLVGPSFREVADRYKRQRATALDHLSRKIIAGGSGVWGEVPMPAHPGLSPAEATTIAQYVLGLSDPDAAPKRLPPAGRYRTTVRMIQQQVPGQRPRTVPQRGSYVLRATYTDKGANGVAPVTVSDAVLLRYPVLAPETAEIISPGITFNASKGDPGFIVQRDGAHIGFKRIDLTGIDRIEVGALTRFYTWSHFKGATVEVRLDSPTGRVLGTPVKFAPPAAATRPTGPGAPPPGKDPVPTGDVILGSSLERPMSVDVSDVSGVHDVYVLFRNADARPTDALLLVTGLEFKPSGAASARAR
jgi:cytochrome c